MNISYTVDNNGYINNYAKVGIIAGGKEKEISNFDEINFDCYKEVNGEIVFDNDKLYQKNIPQPQPLSEIEQLRLEQAQANAEMIELIIAMTGGGS